MASSEDLDKLLAQREQVDRELFDRHSREMAVLFTDIVGSTQFFESHGDIEGLRLVRQHNELLFPVVERHGGRIVKTIGDAIMAVFERPADSMVCAAEMQRTLALENQARQARGQEPIHIRIGAHAGRAMLAEGDVYGDTVNTASRVAHEARGDEVLVSESLSALLPASAGLRCRARGALPLKGKAVPLQVVSLEWGGGPADAPEPAEPQRSEEVFVLEIGLGVSGLKIAALDGAQDKGTVKSYAEVPISRAELDALAGQFAAFMRGDGAGSYLPRVRALGEELFSRALSKRAQQHLRRTTVASLRLQVDDELVHLPWELMHDGDDFLATRFAAGRIVSARTETTASRQLLQSGGPRHALVVSNPSGDLPGAAREGDAVADLLREGFTGPVRHLPGPVTRAAFLGALSGCDLLHFAGHARAGGSAGPGGFLLADGLVHPAEITRAVGGAPPALVFANSCSSSTGTGWSEQAQGTSGLAAALLLHGLTHFVAPMWDIPDADALPFALRFYERALAGAPFGEAVLHARKALAQGAHARLSFAGYVLYGEPRSGFAPGTTRLKGGHQMRSSASALPASLVHPARPRRRLALGAALGATAVLAAGIALLAPRRPASGPPAKPPTEAVPAVVTPTEPSREPSPAAPTARREGPVRVAILPFKNLTGDARLDMLSLGLGEVITTELAGLQGVQLIEHGEVDTQIDYLEMVQTKYFDPGKRAQIGRIAGAEAVVLGAFQRLGSTVVLVGRVVEAETGEIQAAARVEGPERQLLDLEDQFAVKVKAAIEQTKEKLRP